MCVCVCCNGCKQHVCRQQCSAAYNATVLHTRAQDINYTDARALALGQLPARPPQAFATIKFSPIIRTGRGAGPVGLPTDSTTSTYWHTYLLGFILYNFISLKPVCTLLRRCVQNGVQQSQDIHADAWAGEVQHYLSACLDAKAKAIIPRKTRLICMAQWQMIICQPCYQGMYRPC